MIGFAHPWGLLAAAAVPAVLLLHRLRRRLVERRVAALFLFAPERLAEDAGRTLSPLLRTASLWLELAGAALLALLVAGPRLGDASPPPHLVVVLDDTASMGAKGPGRSTWDAARAYVEGRVRALDADGVVTLLATARPPQAIAGPRAPVRDALAALAAHRPLRVATDPGPALDLAVELAGPADEVLFVTDVADPSVPDRVEVAAFGTAAENAALASARRFDAGADETVAVDVLAFSRLPLATTVAVAAGPPGAERELARRAVTLDPGRPQRLTLSVPKSDLPLRVSLTPDALTIDDEAVLLPEHVRLLSYAVDESLAKAPLGIDRLATTMPGVVRRPAGEASLVFSSVEGETRPGTTRVVVAAPAGERDDWLGPFLLDRAHALTEGLTLDGVVWSAGRGPMEGRGLAFAGSQTLLSEETGGGRTVVRLDLDPARSTLAASADWPILLSNVVERARAALPGPAAVNLRVGQELRYRTTEAAPEGGARLRLVAPSGAVQTSREEGTLVFEPAEPGVHRLVEGPGEGREVARVAVAFVDGAESDLLARGSVRRPPRTGPRGSATAPATEPSKGPLRILAALLLAIGVADAWVLGHGRDRGRRA